MIKAFAKVRRRSLTRDADVLPGRGSTDPARGLQLAHLSVFDLAARAHSPDALASVAAFAAVMIGYDSAFIGTSISLASFKNELGLPTAAAAFAPISCVLPCARSC